MKTLVSADQLVGESESMHKTPLQTKKKSYNLKKDNTANLFFIQNMDANDPEKNMPSTAANATMRSAKDAWGGEVNFNT